MKTAWRWSCPGASQPALALILLEVISRSVSLPGKALAEWEGSLRAASPRGRSARGDGPRAAWLAAPAWEARPPQQPRRRSQAWTPVLPQVIFRFALALFKYKEEEILKLQDSMSIFKYLRYFTRTILDAR